MKRIVIVGGGAAGFFAAIQAARLCLDRKIRNVDVLLLEGTRRPLTKVRISGGGRCNVTHHLFDIGEFIKNYPRGSKELRGAMSRFSAKDTVHWFETCGVRLKAEADGRMFPVTDTSQTVIDCLKNEASKSGVDVRPGTLVRSVRSKAEGGFEIDTSGGPVHGTRLLLCTGGSPQGHRMATDLGHAVEPAVPSLFTFKITDQRLADMAGVSFERADLSLEVPECKRKLRQTGPILVTHWGLSGPAVLKLSAWGARELYGSSYKATLTVNLYPGCSRESVLERLKCQRSKFPKRRVSGHGLEGIPRRFWRNLVACLGMGETSNWADVSNKTLEDLTGQLVCGRYQVCGKGEFKEEFVTCGGVRRKEVDFTTMESRLCPGLFFAGEILDVDGITGGFNFQNAWTTGFIASSNMV